MKQKINPIVWFPIVVVAAFIGGFFVHSMLIKHGGMSDTQKKFTNILHMIGNEYVDQVDLDSILEATIPSLLENLDPHSVYIPAEDLQAVNEDLAGSFSGVGVSFTINNDTIQVVEVISGGPAERVGIIAGDRVVKVDGENVAGVGISEEDVFSKLRGEKGTEVKVEIVRQSAQKPLPFTIVRDDIPVKSIDAAYIASDGIGYVKVAKFGHTTYKEFILALYDLRSQGAEDFIIDLRGNPGGLLETSVSMAEEFFTGGGEEIVSIRYRHPEENIHFISEQPGMFSESSIVVLIDEYSASASEIFAGAVQDNDRGLVIGRRSFGKGLVQDQKELPDGSAVRLTVARYYTPSGRCIQKSYDNYEQDLLDRYDNGELFSADSVKFDESLKFSTVGGRTVYGGGGIMPDIFIPSDTTGITSYYLNVFNAGMFQKFALDHVDKNRERYINAINANRDNVHYSEVATLLQVLPSDDALLRQFVDYCALKGNIRARWHYINKSAPKIVNYLKALIARDVLGTDAFFEIYNTSDPVVDKAIELINSGNATITFDE